jgi:hypothetical protein
LFRQFVGAALSRAGAQASTAAEPEAGLASGGAEAVAPPAASPSGGS